MEQVPGQPMESPSPEAFKTQEPEQLGFNFEVGPVLQRGVG